MKVLILVILGFAVFIAAEIFFLKTGGEENFKKANAHFETWYSVHAQGSKKTCFNIHNTLNCTITNPKWNKPVSVVCAYDGCFLK